MMQPIFLTNSWQYWPLSVGDISTRLPDTPPQFISLSEAEAGWLRCTFEMPPNDECSVWWLEGRGQQLGCEFWLNGMYIGVGQPDRFRLEVTHAVRMEENVLLMRQPQGAGWTSIVIRPFDCHYPPSPATRWL